LIRFFPVSIAKGKKMKRLAADLLLLAPFLLSQEEGIFKLSGTDYPQSVKGFKAALALAGNKP